MPFGELHFLFQKTIIHDIKCNELDYLCLKVLPSLHLSVFLARDIAKTDQKYHFISQEFKLPILIVVF